MKEEGFPTAHLGEQKYKEDNFGDASPGSFPFALSFDVLYMYCGARFKCYTSALVLHEYG